jgi:hypothetical protein
VEFYRVGGSPRAWGGPAPRTRLAANGVTVRGSSSSHSWWCAMAVASSAVVIARRVRASSGGTGVCVGPVPRRRRGAVPAQFPVPAACWSHTPGPTAHCGQNSVLAATSRGARGWLSSKPNQGVTCVTQGSSWAEVACFQPRGERRCWCGLRGAKVLVTGCGRGWVIRRDRYETLYNMQPSDCLA